MVEKHLPGGGILRKKRVLRRGGETTDRGRKEGSLPNLGFARQKASR